MKKLIKQINSSSAGKKIVDLGNKITKSKTGKKVINSTMFKSLNKKLSKLNYKQKIGGVILILILGNMLFGGKGTNPQKQYGPYAKETEYFTSGEFCEAATDPSTSFIYSQAPGGSYGYWNKIVQGRYQILGIDADTQEKKQQLKNAYKTWRSEFSKCDW